MGRQFTLEYWQDGAWYVGRLREVPGVFSQGTTLAELEENVRDAYRMMLDEQQRDSSADLHFRDSWSAEDIADLTRFSLQHAADQYPEAEDIV